MHRSRIEFDLKKPFVVRKVFTANGHPMGIGQNFDWKKLAVSVRRMTQLWDAGFITHPGDEGLSVENPSVEIPVVENDPIEVEKPSEAVEVVEEDPAAEPAPKKSKTKEAKDAGI